MSVIAAHPADRPVAKAGATGRNSGIDVLRAAVTLIVVFHHTAITYGAPGGWYYKEIAPNGTASGQFLMLFCATNQAWFMGLFFLLAGYYTPSAFERHGAAGFIRERLLRLGTPLLVYSLALHPLTVALAFAANGQPFATVFLNIWAHGLFQPGPMWFAEALLLFTAVFAALRLAHPPGPVREAAAFPTDGALLAAALATGAAAFLVRLVWPVGVNVAFLQLGYFSSYVVLFAAGAAAARGRRLEAIPRAQERLWAKIALIAWPVLPLVAVLAGRVPWLAGRSEGGWSITAFVYAFWEPFVAWGVILALLTVFQRRFASPGEFLRRLSRRAFLIYIIHPPVLVAVAVAWRSVDAPALAKFAITGSVACALCYLAAGILLRIPAVARIV
jgi:surface polysaccharide O-acyltransferase-like enzyme